MHLLGKRHSVKLICTTVKGRYDELRNPMSSKAMAGARHAFTKGEILLLAETTFAENGIRNTSMGQIAEAVGLTRAALYYYFDSKDELVQATIEASTARYQNFEDLPPSLSLEDAVSLLVTDRYGRVAAAGPTDLRFFYTVLAEQLGASPAEQMMWGALEGYREAVKLTLRRARKRGEIRAGVDLDQAANDLFAHIMGTDLLWLVDPQGVDLERAGRHIAERFLDSVAVPKTA
jgi:AcrR family transcriptional regulator